LNLFCRNSENRENLDHYLNDYVHHLWGRRHLRIDLETSEKHLNALKNVDKNALACSSILGCLGDVGVRMANTKLLRRIRTERRTPIPENITVAGEKACQISMNVQIPDKLSPETYQTNTRSECGGKNIKDVDGRIKPS
jgi:hypothetical protein